MAILRSVPRELIEDALTCLTGTDEGRTVADAQIKVRAIAGLAYAISNDIGFSLRDAEVYRDQRRTA